MKKFYIILSVILLSILFLPTLAFSKSDQQTAVDSCLKQAKPNICMKKLALGNNAIAQKELGIMYAKGQGVKVNYKQALLLFSKSAKQGNAHAQCDLGLMYYNGYGVKKNYKQALLWFIKSAKQGNSDAQFMLGVAYERGDGILKNYKQAVYWYTQSAKQGYADAQLNLGGMYVNGQGVEQDNIKGYAWLSISAYNDNKLAKENIKIIEKRMSSNEINKAQALAQELMKTIKKP